MEESTFTDSRVCTLAEQFVLCRINGEKKEGKPLIARYKVKQYPFQVVLSPDGNVLTAAPDYYDADRYVALLAAQLSVSALQSKQAWAPLTIVAAEQGELAAAQAYLKRTNNDPAASYAVGRALTRKGEHGAALPLLELALSAALDPHESVRLRFLMAESLIALGRKLEAVAGLESVLKLKGASGDEKKDAKERLKALTR